jgi:aminomethyltransferase
VRVSNVTGQRAGIGIRGPLSNALLAAGGFASAPQPAGDGVPALPGPAWRQTQVALVKDASGDGHELWTHADDGIVVWDRLLRVGGALGVSPVGAGAMEILRIESGLPMASVDWQPVQLARSDQDVCTPRELGIDLSTPRRFNGSWALGRAAGAGSHKLVQLSCNTPVVPGALMVRGAAVGSVTSAAWSSARNRGFAIGWLKADLCVPGNQVQGTGRAAAVTCQFVRDCFL